LESPTVTPAPAPPTPPPTVPASVDAVTKGDYQAFHESEAATRIGTPKAPVAVAPELPKVESAAPEQVQPPVAPTAPTLSKRQQDANERIRQAVERATADLRAENDRLRRGVAQPPAVEPQAQREPEWKRFAAMPDAPKLADFESVEDHSAAMALFIADARHAERSAAEHSRSLSEQLTAAQVARVEAFGAQLEAAKVADPTFIDALTPEVRALKPFSALQPGEAAGPHNVVAEQVFDSPIAPQVLRHLSAHPGELARLTTMPPSILALPRAAQAKAHIQWIVREFGKLEGQLESTTPEPQASTPASPISAAPPPLPVLTRAGSSADPKAAALAKGDFASFSALERADRAAKRRSA